MPVSNNEGFETMRMYADYRAQKEKEYAEKFAAEQGGDVADDVAF